jgi:hypothetical protein
MAMTPIRTLLLLLLLALPARAADALFPPAIRVGLVPPAGIVLSKDFPGFEDAERKVAIALAELPPAAYYELERAVFSDQANLQIVVEKRELLPHDGGFAMLVSGYHGDGEARVRKWLLFTLITDFTALVTVQMPEAAAATYPDAVIRTALRSITFRPPPIAEQLTFLPFRLSELAGFSVFRALPEGVAMLTDGPKPDDFLAQPHLIVSVGRGGPQQASDRENFARRMFAVPQGLTGRITGAEAMRISGLPGFEIKAEATDPKSGGAFTVVQWLRFSPGGYLRVVGIAKTESWPEVYPRFRAIRDGVETQ